MSTENITSMKWANVLRKIVLPIATLICLYLFVSLMLEVFGFHVPGFVILLEPILYESGIIDVFHLGELFWIVIGKTFYLGALFVYALKALIHMNKNESRGYTAWLIHLILGFVGILCEFFQYVLPKQRLLYIFATSNKSFLQKIFESLFRLGSGTLNIVMAIVFGLLVAGMIAFIFANINYFTKRKTHYYSNQKQKPYKADLAEAPIPVVQPIQQEKTPQPLPQEVKPVEKKVEPVVNSWICPKCGSNNTERFCETCGSPKPNEPIIKESAPHQNHSPFMPLEKELDNAFSDIEGDLKQLIDIDTEKPNTVKEENNMAEEIKLEVPETMKKDENEITLDLEKKEVAQKEEVVLENQIPVEKTVNEITEMHVDENPFAVNVNKNIDLVMEDKPKYIYCTNCGTPLEDGAKFCGACGHKIQ